MKTAALKIKWTPRSRKDYFGILDYIRKKWSDIELKNFANKTTHTLQLISERPEMFPLSKSRNIRKCVLSKQTTLYYRIREQEIELLTFWDNRQQPDKLKY